MLIALRVAGWVLFKLVVLCGLGVNAFYTNRKKHFNFFNRCFCAEKSKNGWDFEQKVPEAGDICSRIQVLIHCHVPSNHRSVAKLVILSDFQPEHILRLSKFRPRFTFFIFLYLKNKITKN
jgi:hypothetical protein